jgi:hypothetical protein
MEAHFLMVFSFCSEERRMLRRPLSVRPLVELLEIGCRPVNRWGCG